MIVDDELNVGIYVKKSLEKFEDDFIVDYFRASDDALNSFFEKEYDILIFDLLMPKINGFELAEIIREKNTFVPIVFYTSQTNRKDKLRALSAPIYADGYVSKSINSIELLVHQIRSIFWKNEARVMGNQIDIIKKIGASIGHEASQSLTAIKGYSEILKKKLNNLENVDTDKFFKFLDTIKQSANDIADLVENVKNIKKISLKDIGNGDKIIDFKK